MSIFGTPNVEKLQSKGNIDGLIKAIDHEDRKISLDAIKALGNFRDEQSIKALISKLDTFSRGYFNAGRNTWSELAEPGLAAANALVKIGEPAVEYLASTHRNLRVDSRIREGAIRTLGLIGGSNASESLMVTIEEDWDGYLIIVAADVLHNLRNNQIKDRLLALAEKKDLAKEEKFRRISAVKVLGGIHSEDVVQTLVRVLAEEDVMIARAAAASLGEIGDLNAAETLVSSLGREKILDDNIRAALVKMGSAVMEVIIAGLQNPNPVTRRGVASFLNVIGDARALPAIRLALEDDDGNVRWWADKALHSIEARGR